MSKRNKNMLIIALIIAGIILTLGISYAYFTANLSGGEEETTLTVTGGTMNIIFDGGSHISISNIIPSENPAATKIFTVTGNNTTDLEMGYTITLVVTKNTFSSNALKYKLISTNTNDNGEVAPSITSFVSIGTGTSGNILGHGYFDVPTDGNKVHTYNLELHFPNLDSDQNIDQGKDFEAYVSIENFDYNNYAFNEDKGINKPKLYSGMTPVKWNGTTEIITTDDDPDWYNYDNKEWANAKTADGSYWVWIPRYAYKINSGYNSSETGTIDIKFLKEKSSTNNSSVVVETTGYVPGVKDTSMHYFLHPAFSIEGSELGFWVAKFEATANEGVETVTGTCGAGDNSATKTVKIIPNATIWRCIDVSKAHVATLNMKNNPVYGWNSTEVDPHMLTNLEWGAVTYLSKSNYAAGSEEIWNNAYNQYLTGCSGSGVDATNASTCVEYDSSNGQKASTTHNITGVYDMSGGGWERVMANYNNLSTSSGFNTETLSFMNSKYIDKYFTKTEELLGGMGMLYDTNIYGDAVYETSYDANTYDATSWVGTAAGSWYKDYSYLPHSSAPWFNRGGYFNSSTDAGIFSFASSNGSAIISHSFRPTLRSA